MSNKCKGCPNYHHHQHHKDLDVVLAGNPNVGKSVIFNCLCDSYAEVSNYPGTTVSTPSANIDVGTLTDTPGVYSIGNANEEEVIASKIIKKAELVVNVVSALSLERDLFLTLQLLELGLPFILVVNQYDEAKARGLEIDTCVLEDVFGVEVIKTVAVKGEGIEELSDLIKNIALTQPKPLKYFSKKDDEETLYEKRRKFIDKIYPKVVSEVGGRESGSVKLGNLLLNPALGLLVAAAVLFLLYQIIGVFVAGDLVDSLEGIFVKYYNPFVEKLVSGIVTYEPLGKILAGEFGLLTMTVQYLFGVLLPLVVAFNIFMAFFEDSGYLPRLAVLTDRFLVKLGLNGKAIIPIVLGFGCITMATITTRILNTNRERTIAAAILGLTVPCSAQLGIIVGLLAICGGAKAFVVYLAVMLLVLALVGTALNKLLPEDSSHLLLDIPPMRLPRFKNIMRKTFYKTKHFLADAAPLFFLGSFIISVLDITGGLRALQKALAPLTVHILHLPEMAANVFVMGIIRRDFGAAGLLNMADVMNPAQLLTCLVIITLFVPCIAAVVVLYKERGWREASFIWFGSWVLAFVVGALLINVLNLFHYA